LAGGPGIFFQTMNSVAVVMGMPEVLPIAGGLGAMSSWGLRGMILEVIRMVEEDVAMLSIQSVQLT
jgi:hypothetical protein